MANFSDVEREILAHIQRNSLLKRKLSLKQVAEECHVSQSTVVKLAKKMGYTGYVEMAYKLYREQSWASAFHNDLIVGDLELAVQKVARKLLMYSNCKNIIAKSVYRDMLVTYIARKLQIFDISVADTYDFSMIMSSQKNKGFALFCTDSANSESTQLLKVAQKAGYYTIVFSDEPDCTLVRFADFAVVFSKNNYKSANFYNARLMAFLEMVLSQYSRLRMQDKGEHHERD